MPTTTSTSTGNLYALLREALLGFSPAAGYSLQTLLGERLYITQAPETPVFPYGTLRLIDQQRSGAYNGMRKAALLEIQLVGKPWAQLRDLETAADVIEEAFGEFRYTTDGLLFSRSTSRDTLPPLGTPADSQVCTIRIVASLIVWPRFLTRYTTDL